MNSNTFVSPKIDISFPAGSTFTSARFFLMIPTTLIPPAVLQQLGPFYFVYYYLEVSYYPSSTGMSAANPSSLSTILKIVDVARTGLVKLIYISQSTPAFNFTFYPAMDILDPPVFNYFPIVVNNAANTGFVGN